MPDLPLHIARNHLVPGLPYLHPLDHPSPGRIPELSRVSTYLAYLSSNRPLGQLPLPYSGWNILLRVVTGVSFCNGRRRRLSVCLSACVRAGLFFYRS